MSGDRFEGRWPDTERRASKQLTETIRADLSVAESLYAGHPDNEYFRGAVETYKRVLAFIDGTERMLPQ